MEPLVSIVVPIYNAEKYLHRCLDSILEQDFEDYEVILVDDGSTDQSSSICIDYANRDSRFHVILKENTGVSDTRNRGIAMSRGKYLQFVDSDDWLTPSATKVMTEAAEKYQLDLVITHFYRVVGQKISTQGYIDSGLILNRAGYAKYMLKAPANFYFGVMWNKLYRRDIVLRHGISCQENISWCEDFLFNLDYLQHANKILALPIPTYYYFKNKNSLLSTELTFKKSIKMKLMIMEHYKELYKKVDLYDKNKLKVQRFIFSYAKDTGSLTDKLRIPKKKCKESIVHGMMDKSSTEIMIED